jgi:hypothetical protein
LSSRPSSAAAPSNMAVASKRSRQTLPTVLATTVLALLIFLLGPKSPLRRHGAADVRRRSRSRQPDDRRRPAIPRCRADRTR